MEIQDVYNKISNDFDHSRFSVWAGVKDFLDSLESGSFNGDIGCGNGKNMQYRKDIKFEGIDISKEFIKICTNKGLTVNEGDILNLNFNDNYFDNTICIAVIHHLKTIEDRVKAISELLRITKSGGKVLIFVWAMKQPEKSRRQFTKPDEMVPFKTLDGKVFERFYHIYEDDELENEINLVKKIYKINFKIKNIYWEFGNWGAILEKL